MKLLIGGRKEMTKNYQDVLLHMNIDFDVLSLSDTNNMDSYDGFILPGGGDLDPSLFGQSNKGSHDIDSFLDSIQLKLLQHFVYHKKPVLGICKGLQVINVFFGGTIIQDLQTKSLHQYDNGDKIHPTFIRHDSYLEHLYGTSVITNSAHHQGIGALGKDLKIVQIAQDGVVEGLIHTSLPIIAVQWHPERMCGAKKQAETADGYPLFEYFLSLQSNLD